MFYDFLLFFAFLKNSNMAFVWNQLIFFKFCTTFTLYILQCHLLQVKKYLNPQKKGKDRVVTFLRYTCCDLGKICLLLRCVFLLPPSGRMYVHYWEVVAVFFCSVVYYYYYYYYYYYCCCYYYYYSKVYIWRLRFIAKVS